MEKRKNLLDQREEKAKDIVDRIEKRMNLFDRREEKTRSNFGVPELMREERK